MYNLFTLYGIIHTLFIKNLEIAKSRYIFAPETNPYVMASKKLDTLITLSPNKKNKWDVLFSNDGGKTYQVHKTFNTPEEALQETTIVNGSFRLLKDLMN